MLTFSVIEQQYRSLKESSTVNVAEQAALRASGSAVGWYLFKESTLHNTRRFLKLYYTLEHFL